MTTPQTFDIDAWLDGAERPTRSVTIYQRAGLIADLDALEERIRIAEIDEGVEHVEERRLGERTESEKLRAEYARLAQQFHESALTIRVEGRDESEREALVMPIPNLNPKQRGAVVLADAIVSPKFTPEQLEKLAAKVGEVQFSQVVTRFHEACEAMPKVSADFLLKPSTQGDGGE